MKLIEMQNEKKTAGDRNPYRRYEQDKEQIKKRGFSAAEYQERIKKLAKKRGV